MHTRFSFRMGEPGPCLWTRRETLCSVNTSFWAKLEGYGVKYHDDPTTYIHADNDTCMRLTTERQHMVRFRVDRHYFRELRDEFIAILENAASN